MFKVLSVNGVLSGYDMIEGTSFVTIVIWEETIKGAHRFSKTKESCDISLDQ